MQVSNVASHASKPEMANVTSTWSDRFPVWMELITARRSQTANIYVSCTANVLQPLDERGRQNGSHAGEAQRAPNEVLPIMVALGDSRTKPSRLSPRPFINV